MTVCPTLHLQLLPSLSFPLERAADWINDLAAAKPQQDLYPRSQKNSPSRWLGNLCSACPHLENTRLKPCRPTSWLVQWHSTESSPHWGQTNWSNTEFLPSWNHCIYHRRHTTYLSESLFKGNSPFPALGRYHLTLGLVPISSTDLGVMERGGDENKVLQKKNIPMTTLLHPETQI